MSNQELTENGNCYTLDYLIKPLYPENQESTHIDKLWSFRFVAFVVFAGSAGFLSCLPFDRVPFE